MERHERKAIESMVVGLLGDDLYEAIITQINDHAYSPLLRAAMGQLHHDSNPYAAVRHLAACLLQSDKLIQEYHKRILNGVSLEPRQMVMCMDCPNREKVEASLNNARDTRSNHE